MTGARRFAGRATDAVADRQASAGSSLAARGSSRRGSVWRGSVWRGSAGRGSAGRGGALALGLAVAWLALAGSLAFWATAPSVIGWRPYVVMTDSMQPSLAPGDVVLISKDTGVTGQPLRPGDVTLIADPTRADGTRLHRFLRFDPDGGVVTRGDANASEDSPTDASNVRGRTQLVVPSVGLPVVWLRRGDFAPLAAACAGTWLALLVVMTGRRRA